MTAAGTGRDREQRTSPVQNSTRNQIPERNLVGGAENAGVENAGVEKAGVDSRGENAGVEKAGAITYGKLSEQKTLKTPGV